MSPPISNTEPNFVIVPPDPATQNVERLRRQALRLLTQTDADDETPQPASAAEPASFTRHNNEAAANPAPSMIVGILAMPAVFLAIVFVALAAFGKPGEVASTDVAAADRLLQPAQVRAVAPSLASASSIRRGAIALFDDARIQSIALDGDRVALHVEGPMGREIIIFDYREGRQIAAAPIETIATEATDTLGMLTGPPPEAAPTPPAPEATVEAPRIAYARAPMLKPRSLP